MLPAPSPLRRLKDSVRAVLFEADEDEDWRYSTYGGTLFVVSYEGRPYGLTAKHNLQDYQWRQLCVTNQRFGRNVAGIAGVSTANVTSGAPDGSDLSDIAIVEFAAETNSDFFGGSLFPLSSQAPSTVQPADKLVVYGALAEQTSIIDRTIAPVFAELELMATAERTGDPVLRHGLAKWRRHGFNSISGMSGAPVFNQSRQALAGMAVRGHLKTDGYCNLWFLEASAIYSVLSSAVSSSGIR